MRVLSKNRILLSLLKREISFSGGPGIGHLVYLHKYVRKRVENAGMFFRREIYELNFVFILFYDPVILFVLNEPNGFGCVVCVCIKSN